MSWDVVALFTQSAWIERLTAASVDLAVLAALVWGGIRLLRPRSPRLVALLWILVMVRPLIGLAAGPLISWNLPVVSVEVPPFKHVSEEVRVRGAERVETSERVVLGGGSSAALPGAFWLWCAGITGFLLLAGADRLRLRRLLRTTGEPSVELRECLGEAAARLGLSRRALPRLRVTRDLDSPALAGFWRPIILIPAWLVERGSREQLLWALAHELAHWRVGDPAGAAVRQLFRTIFFFHPVAWWVGRRWEEAAELACDRALVSTDDEALSYAERLHEMLAQARGRRRPALATGLFASRTQIGRRIEALLRGPVEGRARLSATAASALAFVALLSLAFGAGCHSHRAGQINADLELTGPEGKLSLDAAGSFTLDRNHADVEGLSPGSFVTLQQEKAGETVRLEIKADRTGKIHRVYTVGGRERPYDWEGRVWMAKTLPRFAPFLEPRGELRFARPITRTWRRFENRAQRWLR